MNTTDYKFEISREFDAPIDLVWKVHTEAEHMKKWFAGPGVTMTHCELDFRVGGRMHYKQEGQNNMILWGLIVYKNIDKPNLIEYISSFSNEAGEIDLPSFIEVWPKELYNTMTFTENNGKTTVSISSVAYNATDEEMKAFEAAREGMEGGYGVTFDNLQNYLAELS